MFVGRSKINRICNWSDKLTIEYCNVVYKATMIWTNCRICPCRVSPLMPLPSMVDLLKGHYVGPIPVLICRPAHRNGAANWDSGPRPNLVLSERVYRKYTAILHLVMDKSLLFSTTLVQSGCSAVWQRACLGGRGSLVQIQSPRPAISFSYRNGITLQYSI